MIAPIPLPSNRPPERFYRGGARITAFRGEQPGSDREPEDWIGSTTTLAGETALGLTTLPDGRALVEAICADPVGWLGQPHLDRFGCDPLLLVKLLDAGERLPVHAHPSSSFARTHLGRAHGKAEAWFILEGGVVHLGLREPITMPRLAALVVAQDTGGMLDLLHRVEVEPGDVVFVPPGVLHAIGAGVFLVELQEPEDLSILLEWEGFAVDGERDGHLGLGFDTALAAVELGASDVAALVGPVLPPAADRYFRFERIAVDGTVTLDAGFSIAIVTDGAVSLGPRGSTVVIPHSAGSLRVQGWGEVVVCRPPAA